jgi:hypothetical protein
VRPSTEDWLTADSVQRRSRVFNWTLEVDEFLPLGPAPARALFLGDSYMQQYYQRIANVIADHPYESRSALFAVRAGCTPGGVALLGRIFPESYTLACRRHIAAALQRAREEQIDTVVIGGSWYTYFATIDPGTGKAHGWQPGSEAGLEQLGNVLRALTRCGKRTFLILSHPWGQQFDPQGMIKRSSSPPLFEVRVNEFVQRTDIGNSDDFLETRLRNLATELGVHVIDPKLALCDDSLCRATTPDGEPIYHDAGHLRPSYVRRNLTFLDDTVLGTESRQAKKHSRRCDLPVDAM